MTQAPTRTPAPSYNSGNNNGNNSGSGSGNGTGTGNNGTSGYGNTGGYSSGYGSYQGGSVAGSSKTGDSRPFRAMAVMSVLGILLLAAGTVIYRRAGKGRAAAGMTQSRKNSEGESRR